MKKGLYDNKTYIQTEVEGDVSYVKKKVCIDNIYIYEHVYLYVCASAFLRNAHPTDSVVSWGWNK